MGKLKKGCGCLVGALVALVAVVAIAAYVLKPKWHDEYGQRFLDIAYGERANNTFDLYLPAGAAQTDSLALVLYVHGGSWIGGDKKEHHADCYRLVQEGYATATMNYSLLTEDSISIPAILDEMEHCVARIAQFAAQQGAPIRQMAIGGTSAGGHLAMMYAYSRTHLLPLRFAAIKVGPSDFRILFPSRSDGDAKTHDVQNFIYACTGRRTDASSLTPQQADSIKLLASPVAYISDSTALPAIFAYGNKDDLIKPAHYRSLQAIYDSLSRPYDLIVYPNSGHILMHDKACAERYDSTLNAYCRRYFGY